MEIWCNKTRKFKKFTPRVFKTILHLAFSRNTRTNRPIPLIDEPDVSHQRKRSKSSPNRLIHTRHTRPLLAIPRWIGEGACESCLQNRPSIPLWTSSVIRNGRRQIFPSGCAGNIFAPKTGPTRFPSDEGISSLARRKPLGENDARRDGIFIFKASLAPFLSFYLRLSFISHDRAHVAPPQHATRGLPPLQWPLSVRPSSLQRAWNDQKVTHKAMRGGNTASRQLPGASVFRVWRNDRVPWRGLFPLTRKIVGNCRREGRKEKSTLRHPLSPCLSILLSKFLALFVPRFSLLYLPSFRPKFARTESVESWKESGSRRTITKNPIILGEGRGRGCNYRDYRIPKRSGGKLTF